MKNKLLKNTAALVVSNILVRLIGLLYKIWLAKTIAPEALGYYQLSLTVYIMFVTLSCSGLPNAVSRHYSAAQAVSGERSAAQVLSSGLRLGVLISAGAAALTALFAPLLSWLILKDIASYIVFLALVPAVFFGGAAAAPGGYFHAASRSGAVAVSELAEQIIKVLSVMLIFTCFTVAGAEMQAAAAAAGLSAGSVISYVLTRLFLGRVKRSRSRKTDRILIKTAAPLTANRFITSFLNMITASLIPIRLVNCGLTQEQAFTGYGIINGMAMPIIMLPCTIISALCVTLLPRLSALNAKNSAQQMRKRIAAVLAAAGLLCSAAGILLALCSGFIGRQLYSSEPAGRYILMLSPCSLFVGINQLCGTCLTAMVHEYKTFRIHITVSAISLAASFVLSRLMGLDGYAIALLIQGGIGSVLFITVVAKCLKNDCQKQKMVV